MSDAYPMTALSSAARTTSGNSDPMEIDAAAGLVLSVETTARSGTSPTLDVRLEDAPTPTGPWATVGSITQVVSGTTLPSVQAVRATNAAINRYVRAGYTIGGTTPSFTFGCWLSVRGGRS